MQQKSANYYKSWYRNFKKSKIFKLSTKYRKSKCRNFTIESYKMNLINLEVITLQTKLESFVN